MQKYKKPPLKTIELKFNPFAESLIIPVVRRENPYLYEKDEEILNNASYVIEKEESTKIYKSSERRKRLNMLTASAAKLFIWITQELDYNKDYLWINKVRYMEENEIGSINTYKTALKDLINNGIIAGTILDDVYWINPSIFFLGNRIKKYPKNVKEI